MKNSVVDVNTLIDKLRERAKDPFDSSLCLEQFEWKYVYWAVSEYAGKDLT